MEYDTTGFRLSVADADAEAESEADDVSPSEGGGVKGKLFALDAFPETE